MFGYGPITSITHLLEKIINISPPPWKFLNRSCTYHAFIILHNLFQAVIFCKLMSSESSWFSNKSTEIKFIIFILFKYFLNPYIECGMYCKVVTDMKTAGVCKLPSKCLASLEWLENHHVNVNQSLDKNFMFGPPEVQGCPLQRMKLIWQIEIYLKRWEFSRVWTWVFCFTNYFPRLLTVLNRQVFKKDISSKLYVCFVSKDCTQSLKT